MANVDKNSSYEDDNQDVVATDFISQKTKLEKSITGVEIKQQEIQKYIADIDNNINFLQGLLPNEKDKEKSRIIRGAISKNIELLTRLYSVNREYEDVKVKYFKNISDDLYKMHHLISVEIRKIDEKIKDIDDADFVGVMKQMMDLVSGEQKRHGGRLPLAEDLQKEMEKDSPEYQL
jgi:hypothetical protein